MSPRATVSSQDLLERRQQPLVLVSSADRDADPTRDRLTIVMADQDSALAQRRDNVSGRLRRFCKNEIGRRRDEVETQVAERAREVASIHDDLGDELVVVLLILDRSDRAGYGEPVDVVRVLDRIDGLDQVARAERETDAQTGEPV